MPLPQCAGLFNTLGKALVMLFRAMGGAEVALEVSLFTWSHFLFWSSGKSCTWEVSPLWCKMLLDFHPLCVWDLLLLNATCGEIQRVPLAPLPRAAAILLNFAKFCFVCSPSLLWEPTCHFLPWARTVQTVLKFGIFYCWVTNNFWGNQL